MKIQDLPLHLRPREKLITKGPANLKDKELVAILLRTGRQGASALDIAELLLKKFPLSQLPSLTLEQLHSIIGIDTGKATTILAAIELAKRLSPRPNRSQPVISSPQDGLALLHFLRTKTKEYFVAIYLNARHELVHQETISVGTINSSLVHPREVFEPAIRHLATSIILAHNHPSGSLEKSLEDQRITDKLIAAGDLLGIDILDHLLITKDGFVSFKAEGWIS